MHRIAAAGDLLLPVPRVHATTSRAHTPPRTTRLHQYVLDTFAEHRACAVLRTPTAAAAPKAMEAAVDGGFKLSK